MTNEELIISLQNDYRALTEAFNAKIDEYHEPKELLARIRCNMAELGRVKLDRQSAGALQKLIEIMREARESIKQEMKSDTIELQKVNKGKEAMEAYRPYHSGMGYTEGKFIDLKK